MIVRRRRLAARRLIADLIRSTPIDISLAKTSDLAEWRKTVDFVKRHDLVPAGHRLEKQMIDGLLRIKLIPGEHPNKKLGPLVPVSIPTRSSALHPSVAAIRDADDKLQVPSEIRRRGLIVLQALVAELERRGIAVIAPTAGATRRTDYYYGRVAEEREGRIDVQLSGVTCSTTIKQHAPLATSPERASLLAIEISPGPHYGPRHWVDGKRRRVEDRLGEVLAALAVAADHAAQRRETLERDRQLRHAKWEAAMARAKILAIEDRHLHVLRQRVEEWRFVEDLRTYAEELRIRLTQQSGGDLKTAAAWLEWARDFLQRYNPLQGFPSPPDDETEPTTKELEAHLGGLSPYGP